MANFASHYDVIIVGAGAAGLAAAHALALAPLNTLVLEARNRPGGRAHTFSDPLGPIDMGAGWLHSADRNPLVAVAQKQGLTIDRSPPPWQKPMPASLYPVSEQRESWAAMEAYFARVSEAAKAPIDRPAADCLEPDHRWNAMINTVSSFVNGVELQGLSVKDFDAYHDTEVNWRLPSGYGAFFADLANALPILYDCPVTAIDHSGAEMRVETARGVLTTQSVIVTLPTNLLAREVICFTPAVPDHLAAAAHLPLGFANKLFLALKGAEEFDPDTRLIGSRDRSATAGYHLRPFGRPMIEVYFGGALARDIEGEGEAGMADFAQAELVALLGSGMKARLRLIKASRWASDPNALGAYSHAKIGYWQQRQVLAEPVAERLFFAGEACSAHDFSTVHGAWQTGRLSARQAARLCQVELEPQD